MSLNDKKLKKWFFSYWYLLLMSIIFLVVVGAYTRSFYQDYQVKREIDNLKKETAQMEVKKMESLELLNYLKSDEFAEKKARLEMNMIKPGEQAVVIKNLETIEKNRQVENNMIKSNLPNYKKWWDYFFNNI